MNVEGKGGGGGGGGAFTVVNKYSHQVPEETSLIVCDWQYALFLGHQGLLQGNGDQWKTFPTGMYVCMSV